MLFQSARVCTKQRDATLHLITRGNYSSGGIKQRSAVISSSPDQPDERCDALTWDVIRRNRDKWDYAWFEKAHWSNLPVSRKAALIIDVLEVTTATAKAARVNYAACSFVDNRLPCLKRGSYSLRQDAALVLSHGKQKSTLHFTAWKHDRHHSAVLVMRGYSNGHARNFDEIKLGALQNTYSAVCYLHGIIQLQVIYT